MGQLRGSIRSRPTPPSYYLAFAKNGGSGAVVRRRIIWASSNRGNRPRVPQMRDLHSVEEVVLTAYDYLDVIYEEA